MKSNSFKDEFSMINSKENLCANYLAGKYSIGVRKSMFSVIVVVIN
jgi:hypothetical protein